MQITTYSDFRKNLKALMDKVFESKAPLFVTRSNGEDMVLLSLDEYNSMQETLHLLQSPKNAKRLSESIDELDRGEGMAKVLKD